MCISLMLKIDYNDVHEKLPSLHLIQYQISQYTLSKITVIDDIFYNQKYYLDNRTSINLMRFYLMTTQKTNRVILRLPQVMKKVPLSKVTIYEYIKQGKFPAPIKLGSRASGWDSLAIDQWIEDRINASKEVA